jgi:hypothetical protein
MRSNQGRTRYVSIEAFQAIGGYRGERSGLLGSSLTYCLTKPLFKDNFSAVAITDSRAESPLIALDNSLSAGSLDELAELYARSGGAECEAPKKISYYKAPPSARSSVSNSRGDIGDRISRNLFHGIGGCCDGS